MQKVKNKRLLIIRFAGLYALTLALLVILFSAFSRNSAPTITAAAAETPAPANAQMATVLAKEEMLRLNFYQLLLNDENYQRAKAAGKTRELPALKDKSDESLVEFESLLNVVASGPESNDPATGKELKKIQDFFKAMLETRELSMGLPAGAITTSSESNKELEKMKMELADKQDQLDDLQTRLAAASKPASNQKEQELQTALNQKNAEISSLQQQLKSAKATPAKAVPVKDNSAQLSSLQGEINAKNKQIAQLRQQLAAKPAPVAASDDDPATVADLEKRNQNLVNGYKVMQTQLGMLQKNYNVLKAENARLKQ